MRIRFDKWGKDVDNSVSSWNGIGSLLSLMVHRHFWNDRATVVVSNVICFLMPDFTPKKTRNLQAFGEQLFLNHAMEWFDFAVICERLSEH